MRFTSLLFLACLPFTTLLADIPPSERNALIALYDSTNGDGWSDNSGWKGPAGTECTWYGVSCNPAGDSVVGIEMSSNNLNGPLPAELLNLTNLELLNLYDNFLSGSIPPEFGNLAQLKLLNLGFNLLSGPLPPELGNLGNLVELEISLQYLSGQMPPELGQLTSLKMLDLGANELRGPIPPELGDLINLEFLWIDDNRLSGPVPATLANLVNLKGSTNGAEQGLFLEYNALFTSDVGLDAFLNDKHNGDWSLTQTVAPANVATANRDGGDVDLTWNPIEYTGDSGGYHVYYGTQAGGPYPFTTGPTTDKTIDQLTITGLDPLPKSYFFVVRTRTEPHGGLQTNTVWSGQSGQACSPPADPGDKDCDGIPDADESDSCQEDDWLSVPDGTTYSGAGNTRLSMGRGISVGASGTVTVETPHRLITKTPVFAVPKGAVFRVEAGAQLLIYPEPDACSSF